MHIISKLVIMVALVFVLYHVMQRVHHPRPVDTKAVTLERPACTDMCIDILEGRVSNAILDELDKDYLLKMCDDICTQSENNQEIPNKGLTSL